ncbi:hypothetical protein YTPLAS18_22230 [Nitrospira sp.]|nr:hypothetical protein YTPLAS18_22230 [Nitrospira sp.]
MNEHDHQQDEEEENQELDDAIAVHKLTVPNYNIYIALSNALQFRVRLDRVSTVRSIELATSVAARTRHRPIRHGDRRAVELAKRTGGGVRLAFTEGTVAW